MRITLKIFIVILLQITFIENVYARYIQADPIGIDRDYSDPVMQVRIMAGMLLNNQRDIGSILNPPYVYGNSNPILNFDPFGLDVTINIRRDTYTKTSVMGKITVSSDRILDTYSGYTLENARGGQCQCKKPVTSGSYEAYIRNDHSPKRIELIGVPGYTRIQIHNGNEAKDVEGCFAVGNTAGENKVGESRDAMGKILEIINKDATKRIVVNVFD